ncbi:MAG: nucleoside deaminase [Methanobacteriaceae archaeon]|nr:nucleoside deaminase [Methanobacteriaceae archaeon]
MKKDDLYFLKEAIKEAKLGQRNGGLPIGSVLVKNNIIIGRGHNRRVQEDSVILHAEMSCLENAGRLKAHDYKQCTIYSTLSPCDMCSGAILLYNIPRVVIGENENFKGPEEYLYENGVDLVNLNLEECKTILSDFIYKNPILWYEDICIE